jgi:Hint-domain/von Willebrand factor type A domain/VWA / Hh  protein intein-like/U-box domain
MNQNNEDIFCPINNSVMTDPVVAEDGYSYEREAIQTWFSVNNTSPITREIIGKHLIINYALRSIIDQRGLPVKSLHSIKAQSTGVKIVLVLDVSGSMDIPAKENMYEPTFSRLDIVKHSVAVIGGMLSPNDKLCVVTFNHSTNIIMPWTTMNDEGKRKNLTEVKKIKAGGSTDIPKGIQRGIEQMGDHIILLTDGENSSTILPGEIESILAKHTGKIHTVGLGMTKELDTELLRKVSNLKNGFYCYCPDQSMVGSVFIHLIANICVNEPGDKFEEYDKFLSTILDIYSRRKIVNLPNFRNPVLNEEFISDDENKGQIGLAVKPNEWINWGRHYLPAFIDAHVHRMTTNFKDTSMQIYKTPRTDEFIKKGELIFATITPPVPSCNNDRGITYTATQFLQSSLDSSNGCFGPDTMIGDTPIKNLRKGDIVITKDGPTVVKCLIICPYAEMVKIEDFWITKKHPILLQNKWIHPGDLSRDCSLKRAYNLVLESHHTVLMGKNLIAAVTLCHGMTGDVVEHDYLGTNKIINDLSRFPGWEKGTVYINGFIRNNGGICGIF